MSQRHVEHTNLEALDRFWRRSHFHDEFIEHIAAMNKRVVIRLKEMTLVITGATGLKPCELPAVWLYQSVAFNGGGGLDYTGSFRRVPRGSVLRTCAHERALHRTGSEYRRTYSSATRS